MTDGADVAYVRISKDLNLERLGTARQEQDCRELAARRGLSDPIVIADDDTSAYALKRKRPGWSRLLTMIEQDEVRTLLSYASDRLYRRLTELESLITLLEAHPVEILTVTSGDIDLATADGRMLARFLGSVSQNSSEKSAERIIRAHRAIAEAGRWKGGGPRPLGYETDGITIREAEAAFVREAAAFILAGGSTVKAARWLSERLDRTITAAGLGKALRSPHIAGHRLHVPQTQRDAWEQRRAAGEVVGDQPPHALVTHTRRGTWQPVLDEETWRRLLGHYLSHARFERAAKA